MKDDAAAWQFWIDVGGTFTDCVARRPDGRIVTCKLLSTGRVPTVCTASTTAPRWHDPGLRAAPAGYYEGWEFTCAWPGQDLLRRRVRRFDPAEGALEFDAPLPSVPAAGTRGELTGGEEAPVAGIRWLLGRRLDEPLGPVRVRLGTTRATNALLERQGARTALVTTAGFADALRIGYQDRPALFDLRIDQPPELCETVVALDERMDADGQVLRALDERVAREQLAALRAAGIESLAVCFLHAHRNPAHEDHVGRWAAEAGFEHVFLSSQVSPLPKFVYRGDTMVLDSYLTPLLRGYCRRLASQMPQADIRYMTSAGSLVAAEAFSGKDAILSGPAGGVVGAARVADRAALAPAFAFDMGGTSTDVSRWDGHAFTRRYEMEVGGSGTRAGKVRRLRLQTSMLEIETVAAGGGSVCWFDGQKIVVGPRSAGADPGPACYGRGGPLTVTDINVFLGRMPKFPFPLDLAAVEERLDGMLAQIREAGGRVPSRAELAGGYLRVANANMVAPIKKLAAARGQDVRTHTLLAFGGAGGQHACALARELGMPRVLCSPYAGVFSALGIGLAGVTKFAVRALPLSTRPMPARWEELERIFSELEADLRRQMSAEGVAADTLGAPCRLLEMRYRGQEARLTVPEPADGDFAAEFFRQHDRLFHFTFPGRGVEYYAARVELSTSPEPMPVEEATAAVGKVAPAFYSEAFHGALAHPESTAVYERDKLCSGVRIQGPAIILEPVATVVVEPGWTAEISPHGDLILTDRAANPPQHEQAAATGGEADPVELELFHNRLTSVAEQMGAVLQRTALSTNVKERLDFSCAVFDAEGCLIANAAHIPVHLGAMQECVRCLREDVPAMQPGEVYVTNDPFRGGSHLPDVTVVTPVFAAGLPSVPAFFTASRAHHAEIGGIAPGSLPPSARTLAEEGVLIRAFRYRTDAPGASDVALRALFLSGPYPSRSPDENLADLHAQIAANATGVQGFAELIAAHGMDTVTAYAAHLQCAAADKMRAALKTVGQALRPPRENAPSAPCTPPAPLAPASTAPAGGAPASQPDTTRTFTDTLDDGTPLVLSLTVRVDGTATFDFTGSGPVHPGNLNANRAIVASAVIYCLRCLLGEPVPLNAGLLVPVEIIIPPDTLLDPAGHADPRRCPAVGGGNVETSQRLVDVILGALGLVAASQGTMNNLLFGRGGPDAFGYYETIGGGSGAGPTFPGASAVHVHMTNTRLTDPEVLETRYPVRLREWSVRRGSGGAGQHPGGDGMVRELEFLAPLSVSLLTSRRLSAPYGVHGGQPGRPGRNLLRRTGEPDFTALPPAVTLEVHPGDILRLETPGGGGWGAEFQVAGTLSFCGAARCSLNIAKVKSRSRAWSSIGGG